MKHGVLVFTKTSISFKKSLSPYWCGAASIYYFLSSESLAFGGGDMAAFAQVVTDGSK